MNRMQTIQRLLAAGNTAHGLLEWAGNGRDEELGKGCSCLPSEASLPRRKASGPIVHTRAGGA